MIHSISNINHPKLLIDYSTNSIKKDRHNAAKESVLPLNYEIGQAILAKNCISFKNNKEVPINSVFDKKVSGNSIQTKYFYDSKNQKDDYTAFYTTMLLVLMTPPFYDSSSNIETDSARHYHKLKIYIDDGSDMSYKSCYQKQQQLMNAVFNTNFESTLKSIKEYDIELLNEDFENGAIDNITKENNIKIIDNITSDDIKNHMKKYLIDCNPLVSI